MFTKQNARRAVFLGVLLAIIGIMTGFAAEWFFYRDTRIGEAALTEIRGTLLKHGPGPELNETLAKVPKPGGFVAITVTEAWTSHRVKPATVAAYPPKGAEPGPLPGAHGNGLVYGIYGSNYSATDAQGNKYVISQAVRIHRGPMLAGFVLAMASAALSWVALALWVFLDASQRGNASAPGWLLLTLLTGPLGLAVWVIQRSLADEPVSVCPGCGHHTPANAAFCVQCGHGLRPTCHECRTPVQHNWSYCPSCGTDLAKE